MFAVLLSNASTKNMAITEDVLYKKKLVFLPKRYIRQIIKTDRSIFMFQVWSSNNFFVCCYISIFLCHWFM